MFRVLLLVLALVFSSCGTTHRHYPDHELAFFDEYPVGQSRAYREYQMLSPGGRSRISYLLWRMEYSPLKFWRNGSDYSAREGAAWLRWKLRKFYPEVDNADTFIEQVATQSNRTALPYKAYCSEFSCMHDLRDMLFSELHALEAYEVELAAPDKEAAALDTAERAEEKAKGVLAEEAGRAAVDADSANADKPGKTALEKDVPEKKSVEEIDEVIPQPDEKAAAQEKAERTEEDAPAAALDDAPEA